MNWSKKDIEKVKLPHNFNEKPPISDGKKVKLPPIEKVSVEKETIKKVLWVLHRENKIPDYVEEFQFHPKRKFRFDWAIPSLKIGIEFEGLMSKKSRHTTVSGYTNDCTKYNLAQSLGWKVLRYTVVNYKDLSKDLKVLLKK